MINVYCDESGDLGWIFNKPFGLGGSSRYLTIAFLLVPKELSHLPKRIVKKLYHSKNQSTRIELKANKLTTNNKVYFATKVNKLLINKPQIQVFAITVNKRRVEKHIRIDPNKLYNYMIGLSLLDKIIDFPEITFIPDKRAVKVKSGNSLVDYLEIKLWFESNSITQIHYQPQESHQNLSLQFVDFISNIIWNHYEYHNSIAYNVIKDNVDVKHLFFRT